MPGCSVPLATKSGALATERELHEPTEAEASRSRGDFNPENDSSVRVTAHGDPNAVPLFRPSTARPGGLPVPSTDAPRSPLDLGPAVDPGFAERQGQQAQLGAEALLRVPVEQDGTMGLELFDRANAPELDMPIKLIEDGPVTTIRTVLDGIDADQQALDDLTACYTQTGAAE